MRIVHAVLQKLISVSTNVWFRGAVERELRKLDVSTRIFMIFFDDADVEEVEWKEDNPNPCWRTLPASK
jgi:hypothetical protein